MRLSPSIICAAIAAILMGGFVFWFHEHYVLSTSYGPGTTIGEAYKGRELPTEYMNYRYIISPLFGLATFAAVYFWFSNNVEMEGGTLGFCFLIPTALNYIFILTIFITPLLILGLLIRTFFLYMRNQTVLYRAYLSCSIFNCISLIVMFMNLNESFRYA